MSEEARLRELANTAFWEDTNRVGSGVAIDGAPFLTIAIGRGFAMCATLRTMQSGTVLTDAGQLVLHSNEPDESAVLDVLRRRHGQLAVAQVLCEGGILELHRAVCQLRGIHPWRSTAAQVILAATQGKAPECAHTLAMFCGLLGDVAGRAALTLGAAGGVFISGPVVMRLGEWFARSPFRRRFDATGRLADTLRAIPTIVGLGDAPHAANSASLRLVGKGDPRGASHEGPAANR